MWIVAMWMGCAPKVQAPDLPDEPDFDALINQFETPTGTLDSDASERLKDWLLADGGVAFLGSSILLQNIIPELTAQLGGSFMGGGNLSDIPLTGDGWIRATLPCHNTMDIDAAFLQVHARYTEVGINPNMWGNATQCNWAQWGITLDASLAMVLDLPLDFLDTSSSSDRVMLAWDGEGNVGDYGFDMTYVAKLQSDRVYTIWTDEAGTFVIDLPNLDAAFLEDLQDIASIEEALEDLQALSLGIDTAEGRWECMLIEARCVGRDGIIVDEVLSW